VARRLANRTRRGATREVPASPPRRPCVVYARVSSKELEREAFSIPAHQRLLNSYVDDQRFQVVKEFVDVETAKRAGCTNFTKMLAWLKKNRTTCRTILVEKTDRRYRNLKDWVVLDELDLEIHLVKEGIVLSDEARSTDKFMHGIRVLTAKNYIDNLSEAARWQARHRARPQRLADDPPALRVGRDRRLRAEGAHQEGRRGGPALSAREEAAREVGGSSPAEEPELHGRVRVGRRASSGASTRCTSTSSTA